MTFPTFGLPTPTQIVQSDVATNQSWAKLLLSDGGFPITDNNVNNVMSWMAEEEPPESWFNRNNPLNSGQGPAGGDSGLGGYPDLNSAAFYTAQLINEPNMSDIAQALTANASFDVFVRAVQISPWDGGYPNGLPAPGSIPVVTDAGAQLSPGSPGSSSTSAGTFNPADIGASIAPPAPGMASNLGTNSFFINDAPMDLDVSNANINIDLTLDATQVSIIEMTLHDPMPRTILNSVALAQQSVLTIDGMMFQLTGVDKQGSKLQLTFEPWVVVALQSAIGSVTLPPGIMTRTAFAGLLVAQVQTAVFSSASEAFLFSQDDGYAHNTLEQLSRGTTANPTEDSWTCLQRLATEIGWRCYEQAGTVFFGPDSWLMAQPPVLTASEGQNGIGTIDGTFDLKQPLATLTLNDVSGSWAPVPGDCINVTKLGPMSGPWLVVTLNRPSIAQPDVTITVQKPQPQLPEPSTGGAQAAVGAGFGQPGNQQSTGGSAAATQALKYAVNQLGIPYQWGGDNPQTGFDCSGLMQAAYASAGQSINRTSEAQFAEFPILPTGGGNLRGGDLVYFVGADGQPPGHVGMFVSYDAASNTATMIDAPYTGVNVRYDTFTPDIGVDGFMGANRPTP